VEKFVDRLPRFFTGPTAYAFYMLASIVLSAIFVIPYNFIAKYGKKFWFLIIGIIAALLHLLIIAMARYDSDD